MKESLIATFIFWSTFCFTVGPFWIAIMETAKHHSFKTIYKNYFLYQLTGWLSVITIIGVLVGTLGKLSGDLFVYLHFLGGLMICYLAYKTLLTKRVKGTKFNFNWKAMILLSYSNPKVWLTVPAGFLAANYTDFLFLNILIYYAISLPIFWIGLFFWGMVGRKGAKITNDRLSYFNAILLLGFAVYLFYQGWEAIGNFS